ncbi:tetratricopeptide repeat protein, partial [Catenulispora sp. NF23]|nr:tetratricopeptide repeat protein [Catenulispora pinistramenti]
MGEDVVRAFAEVLREHRLRAGLTQEQLADLSGVSVRTIAALEAGRGRTPRPSSVTRLAEALRLPEDARLELVAAAVTSVTSEVGAVAEAGATGRADATGVAGPEAGLSWRFLPHDVGDFVGRDADLARFHELVTAGDRADGAAGPVTIVTIDGMAGVGKSALALHAAHGVADRYPDGQFFLRFHGFTPGRAPVDPATALQRFLGMVGVPEKRIPADAEDRAALWRATLAGRRVLVVLDDAPDADHVRPLIPGGPGSLVVVTSRRRLAGLDGAAALSLGVFEHDDALALFQRVAGTGHSRVHDASDGGVARGGSTPDGSASDGSASGGSTPDGSTAAILDACGHLPLAIRIAAAWLAHRPAWTVRDLAYRLAADDRPLAELSQADRAVASAFNVSYAQLDGDHRRMFRLLAAVPGEDVDVYAAAALAALPVRHADGLLQRLLDDHLVLQASPGRFHLHDLIAEFASELVADTDPPDWREAALERLVDYYLAASAAASDAYMPEEAGRRPETPKANAEIPVFADIPAATQWLEAELGDILAAALAAADAGSDRTPLLSRLLFRFLHDTSHHREAILLHGRAVAADDPENVGYALTNLAGTYRVLGRYQESVIAGNRAAEVFGARGELPGRARALGNLALSLHRLGRYDEATDVLTEGIAIYHEAGDRLGEARLLGNLGGVLNLARRLDAVLPVLLRAVELGREIGTAGPLSIALGNIGSFYIDHGRHDEALAVLNEALELDMRRGRPADVAATQSSLGVVYGMRGEYEQAILMHRESVEFFEAAGIQDALGEALCELAGSLRRSGRPAEAVAEYRRAIELCEQVDNRREIAEAHAGLGYALAELGD